MTRALFLGLFFVCAFPAQALRYVLTPTLGVGVTVDDRIRDAREDRYLRTMSGLDMDIEQSRCRIHFAGEVGAYTYREYAEYDRVDQKYAASIDYGWTERLRFGLSGSVRLDTDYEDEYEEGRIVDAESTDRRTSFWSPSVSFFVTPRDNLGVVYSHIQRDNEAAYNPDYRGHILAVTWTHQYSELLDFFVRANAQRTAYESYQSGIFFPGALEQDTLSVVGGLTYRPSERLAVSLGLGGGETFTSRDESEVRTVLGRKPLSAYGLSSDEEDSSSLNYLVNSGLEWRGERFAVKGGYDRDIYSSSRGEDVLRDSLSAGLSFRVTELSTIGASALVRHLVDNTDRNDRDDWYYSMNPYLKFQLSKDSTLRLGYIYSKAHEKGEDAETRNRCTVDYVISFPFEY